MYGRRTFRRTSIALTLVAALFAAGCGGDDDDEATGEGTEDTGAPATAADLALQTWQLRSYADNTSEDLASASETSVATATFDGTQAVGSTGCNRYNAPYTLASDGAISFGEVASTRMACSEDLTAQEQGFLAGLADATKAVLADDALQLLNANDDVVLIFVAPEGTLIEGASWKLINYRTPTAVSSSILGADITAEFVGGTVTGNSGCNDYTASYTSGTASTGDLTITDIERGGEVCTTPEGVMEQEQSYADALATVVGYTIVGDRLTLLDAQGRNAAQFELS